MFKRILIYLLLSSYSYQLHAGCCGSKCKDGVETGESILFKNKKNVFVVVIEGPSVESSCEPKSDDGSESLLLVSFENISSDSSCGNSGNEGSQTDDFHQQPKITFCNDDDSKESAGEELGSNFFNRFFYNNEDNTAFFVEGIKNKRVFSDSEDSSDESVDSEEAPVSFKVIYDDISVLSECVSQESGSQGSPSQENITFVLESNKDKIEAESDLPNKELRTGASSNQSLSAMPVFKVDRKHQRAIEKILLDVSAKIVEFNEKKFNSNDNNNSEPDKYFLYMVMQTFYIGVKSCLSDVFKHNDQLSQRLNFSSLGKITNALASEDLQLIEKVKERAADSQEDLFVFFKNVTVSVIDQVKSLSNTNPSSLYQFSEKIMFEAFLKRIDTFLELIYEETQKSRSYEYSYQHRNMVSSLRRNIEYSDNWNTYKNGLFGSIEKFESNLYLGSFLKFLEMSPEKRGDLTKNRARHNKPNHLKFDGHRKYPFDDHRRYPFDDY